jgi:hypothetical protein
MDPSTHVVEVNFISKLREECRRDELCSPTFTVDGLDWMVCCNPDGKGDEQGYMCVGLDKKSSLSWLGGSVL